MKPRNRVLIGIILTCLAWIFFIYVLEAKTIFPDLYNGFAHFNIIKYVGYLIALIGVIFLFAALILLSSMKSDFLALEQLRASKRRRPDSDFGGIIKIVRFTCLNCGKRISAEYNKKKGSVECPHCQVSNLVPEAAVESAEEVILQKQNSPGGQMLNSAKGSNGFSVSFTKILAWADLIILFAAGIFLLVKGLPGTIDAKFYWGLGLMYAGLNIATLLFVMSTSAFNLAGSINNKEETI